MRKTLTRGEAIELLLADEYASWSYAGAGVIIDDLMEIEEQLDDEMELDIVGIRCEYNELEREEIVEEYGYLLDDEEYDEGEDRYFDDLMSELEDQTRVIKTDEDSYIVKTF